MLFGIGTFGSIVAFGAGLGGLSALHEIDSILKPITSGYVNNYAVGGWMAAGAAIGRELGARFGAWAIGLTCDCWRCWGGLGATAVLVWLALRGAMGM